MAPDSSTLAWKIPWTEEPCRLQSMPQELGLELNKILKPAFQLFVYTDSLEGNVSACPVYRCAGNIMVLDLRQFNFISIFVET